MYFTYISPRVILTYLFLILIGNSLIGQNPRAQVRAAQNARFKAIAVADSSSNISPNNQDFHCQVSFEIPTGEKITNIHLEVTNRGNTRNIRTAIIPLSHRGRRRNGVGFTIVGNKVWLDLGKIRGNPNYRANIRLENDQGQLSAPIDINAN